MRGWRADNNNIIVAARRHGISMMPRPLRLPQPPPPPPPTDAWAAKQGRPAPPPRGHPSGHPLGGYYYARPVAGFAHALPPNRGDRAPAAAPPSRLDPGRAVAAAAAAIDMNQYHLPQSHVLPVYRYSTVHRGKSWDEMVALFKQFVEREGHGDVEMDDRDIMFEALEKSHRMEMEEDAERESSAAVPAVHMGKPSKNPENAGEKGGNGTTAGNNADLPLESSNGRNSEDDNDEDLMLRSWVREVRWVIRAEGLGQDGKLPRSTAASGSNENKVRRCDSEAVTPERLAQLERMPDFPLLRNNHKSSNNVEQHRIEQESCKFGLWLDDLMHYRAKNGGCCNVPQRYPEYPKLGKFVNGQRTEYRKLMRGKASSMTRIRVRELDRVAFTWSVRKGSEHTSWDTRLDELRAYHRTYGHANVPKNYPQNPSLAHWVNEQRHQYRLWSRGETSNMNATKVSRLNSIGFMWVLLRKRSWEEWM